MGCTRKIKTSQAVVMIGEDGKELKEDGKPILKMVEKTVDVECRCLKCNAYTKSHLLSNCTYYCHKCWLKLSPDEQKALMNPPAPVKTQIPPEMLAQLNKKREELNEQNQKSIQRPQESAESGNIPPIPSNVYGQLQDVQGRPKELPPVEASNKEGDA